MSTPLPSESQQQILFWPRWSESNGMIRLWDVAKTVIRQGSFQLLLRHDPSHDGALDVALKLLKDSFHSYFGDAIAVNVSLMTGKSADMDWQALEKEVNAIYLFGDEPNDDLARLGVPKATDLPNLMSVLGFNVEKRSPSELFQTNLRAIERRNSSLAMRLRNAAPCSHLRRNEGQWEIRFRRHWVALVDEPVEVPVDSEIPILLLGLGVGGAIASILEKGAHVVAWDRDPWLMAVTLSQRDWSEDILNGNLRLLLGPDILTIPHTYVHEWRHPLLAELYAREIKLWTQSSRPIALMVMGELFVDDAADALERQGYSVYMWDTKNLPPEELSYVAKQLRPHLVMSINYQKGLAEGCHGLGLPLVVWEIDPALDHLQPCQTTTEHCQIYTWRKRQVQDWQSAGFKTVQHLPLAANHRRRTPGILTASEALYGATVSFVGSSLSHTLTYCQAEFIRCWQRWSGRGDSEEPKQIIEYILQFHRNHPSIYVVEDILSRRCPGLEAHTATGVSPNMLIGELVAHQYRRQVMESLTPFGIRVWGDEGWRGVDASGGRFMGPASHNHDVTRVYRGSLINIDVGRRYQRDIVTMRVFDVLACGGFVLAEDCEDLRACFEPGVHLDTWSTIEELVEKTEWYRTHPETVKKIRAAGHDHCLEFHTIDQRVARLVSSVTSELVV